MAEKNAVLITGASGFIGHRLASFLSDQGAEVHAVVRSESRIDELRALRNVSIHVTDGSTSELVEILGEASPRCVYHLASRFVGEHAPDDVASLIASNVQFGAQLLEAMKETAVPGLVTAGTSWQHFEGGAARPVNLYAATKEAFETIARYYADAHHLKAITLKLFDSYGPDDKRRKLFWHLRRAAETGERVAMSGGEQILEMVYVDDVVRAFIVAGQRISMMPPSTVEAYCAPSQQPMTLRKIADIYEQVVGRTLNLEWGGRAYRPREVFQPWSGDPILPGWQARVSLEQGIRFMEGIEGKPPVQ